MSAAFFGLWHLLLVLGFGFVALPAPLWVPPLPEDPVLMRTAPTDTLLYFQWFGCAEPDPRSDNATERLAAEPQVQELFGRLWDAVGEYVAAEASDPALARDLLDLAKRIAQRPGCVFVCGPGLTAGEPDFRGAAVLALGEHAAAAGTLMRRFEGALAAELGVGRSDLTAPFDVDGVAFRPLPTLGGSPPVVWAVSGGYLALAVGADVPAAVARGLRGGTGSTGNAAITELFGKVRVARPCSRSFVDLGRLLELARTAGGEEVDRTLTALGARGLRGLVTEAGLEGKGFAARTLLAMTGEPAGLLKLADGRTLTAADLAIVPEDATIAVAVRCEPARVLAVLRETFAAIDPILRTALDHGVAALDRSTGVDLERDLLAHVGDTVSAWSSPAQGGLLLSGATIAVSLADAAAFRRGFDALMAAVAEQMPRKRRGDDRRFERGVHLDRTEHKGHQLWFLNTIGDDFPVAPAWCVTDSHLLVSLFPQMLKAAIDRAPDAPSLAGRVEAELAPGTAMLGWLDAKAAATTLYPVLHPLAQLAAAELQREGFDIDVSALPAASALLPHLGVEVNRLSRTDAGLMLTRQGTIPGVDPLLGLALPVGIMGLRYYSFVAAERAQLVRVPAAK